MENTTNSHPPAGTQPIGGGDVHVSANCRENSASAGTLLERFDRSRLATVLIFAVVAIGFWLMNHWTPYQGDDYSFNFISEAEKCTHRVENVEDLFSAWGYHYMHGNGRFADDGCVRPSHFWGKPIFNILNTLVFLAFAALAAKLGAGACGKIKNSALVIVVALWGFLMPIPWQSTLWQTGACNYLWATTAALLWLFLFKKSHTGSWSKSSVPVYFVLFFVSVICAWFHEGIAPVIALCAGIYGVANFKKLTRAEKILTLGFFLGTALVVFSPGIILRATSGNSMSIPPLSVGNLVKAALQVAVWSKVSILLVAILGVLALRARKFLWEFIRGEWFLIAVWIVALGYNVFLRGAGGERNCFFLESIAVVLVLTLFSAWNATRSKSVIVAGTGLAVVFGFGFVVPGMLENSEFHKKFDRTAKGGNSLFIPAELPEDTSRFVVHQSPGDANFGDHHNLAISRYYGRKERVFIAPQSFWDAILEEDNFCVPANEFSPGWYSAPDTPFAVKKIITEKDCLEPEQIKYVNELTPTGFFAEKIVFPLRKCVSGQGKIFETDFGDLDTPRILEMPSGKYFVIPLSKKVNYVWKIIPRKTTAIKTIEKDAN